MAPDATVPFLSRHGFLRRHAINRCNNVCTAVCISREDTERSGQKSLPKARKFLMLTRIYSALQPMQKTEIARWCALLRGLDRAASLEAAAHPRGDNHAGAPPHHMQPRHPHDHGATSSSWSQGSQRFELLAVSVADPPEHKS